MDLICTVCASGTASDGNPCKVCSGDGKINLIDDDFPKYIKTRALHGIVWAAILTNLSDIITKIDTLDAQHDALDTKLDIIETKIDAL